MTFDFGGARFDPARDRKLLGFVMSQFLYGEVTGIQCGLWLHTAPDLDAATFFARQATEELSHVRSIRRILAILGAEPEPAHRLVRFLAQPADSFAEHVCLEMALGEGFVLMVFYALCDTVDSPEVVRILEAATRQEERHVGFGEDRTRAALASGSARLRRSLLGQSLLSVWAIERFGAQLGKLAPDHAVMRQLPAFVRRAVEVTELRLRRMDVLDRPLADIGAARRFSFIASAVTGRLLRKLVPRRQRLLTDTYLDDPVVTQPAAVESGEP